MSRSAIPAALLLLLATVVHGDTAAAKDTTTTTTSALDQVCGSLGGYYVTPSLCVSALCSDATDPCRAAAHDAHSVAALAARLVARNATAAQRSIQAFAAKSGNATSASSCQELYGGAVPALRWAAASVAAGRYRGAREVIQAAQYAAAGCGGTTEGTATAAMLPPENGQFSDMAFVAHAVVAYMVPTY